MEYTPISHTTPIACSPLARFRTAEPNRQTVRGSSSSPSTECCGSYPVPQGGPPPKRAARRSDGWREFSCTLLSRGIIHEVPAIDFPSIRGYSESSNRAESALCADACQHGAKGELAFGKGEISAPHSCDRVHQGRGGYHFRALAELRVDCPIRG